MSDEEDFILPRKRPAEGTDEDQPFKKAAEDSSMEEYEESEEDINNKEVKILYGSQTGNCEAISKCLLQLALEAKLNAKRLTLNEVDLEEASGSSEIWVIVCSSTGRGLAPANARQFLPQILLADTKPDLSKIKYTILGLGDSSYADYQGFPRRVEQQMKDLGAK